MAKKYFAANVKISSDYTSKMKNIEMMKSAKSSQNPTLNYQLKGKDFIRFWNYDIYLSLVKAYTDMKSVVCDNCKSKIPPSSILDGITSYQCFEDLEEIMKNCQTCKDLVLYPYGTFANQREECFKFPRKITNDPCEKPSKLPCPVYTSLCTTSCTPNLKGSMVPCCMKQTKPCVPDAVCDIPVTICTNPLLSCDPCCKKYSVKCGCKK